MFKISRAKNDELAGDEGGEMDEFEIELQKDFLCEAIDLLQDAEKDFLQLEKEPQNKQLIDAIFRFAHNLKGTSRAVGLGEIAEITHKAENLLLDIKDSKIIATPHIVNVLLAFKDKVSEMIEGLSQDLSLKFDCVDLSRLLDEASRGEGAKEDAELVSLEIIQPNEEAEIIEESLFAVEEIHVETPQIVKENNVTPITKQEPRKDDETIRVSLNRLEKLNDLVGELVILRSLVESSLLNHGESKTARSLEKLCKDIQDMTMSLRMVSVGPTFQKLNRVVRDTSKLLGKNIELRLMGEDTEIDKTVIESLSDPLVHIVRNSLDHGIETSEARLLAGKSEAGTVEVMAFHEGNYLVIQITDDGKGINPDTLINIAMAKGIIGRESNLTHQQGIELIFHPGFSTKDAVSEISGRGVGMDVVKTNIEALGGEVQVRSKIGVGSCFRLILPLTLAIIEGLLIESGEQCYIVPKAQVHEVIRLDFKNITKMTGQTPYLRLRDEVIPLYELSQDLIGKSEDSPIALIVRNGQKVFAVAIKDVLKLQQVVVKPATKELSMIQGVMGATILGNGNPSLILDLINFYAKRMKNNTSRTNTNTHERKVVA